MALHDPPYYRYLLPRPWDKEVFAFIKTLAVSKKYPRIVGTTEDKNKYINMLIRTQKSTHDWRDFLKDSMDQVNENGSINAHAMILKYPPDTISTEIPLWATYPEDKMVSDFIDGLAEREIKFVGSDGEIGEFVLRFILGQLGHDWESTILMIWEKLGDGDTLSVRDLNSEMKNFDYLKIFEQ